MKKDYLTKLLRDECKYWSKKKVLITAPTGMGKSTFIIHELLPYLKERGKKLLILCNRRLLRDQYWQNLVQVYDCYDDLEKSVELMTYQQLAEKMNKEIVEETIDEAPFVYKPIQEIIDNIKDTVEIQKIIKPIYNFKAKN